MLATLFALATLTQAQSNRATSILENLIAALRSIETAEFALQSVPDRISTASPYTALVKVSREPMRYWAKLEGTGDIATEYVSYSGQTVTYTETDGRRTVRQIPQYNIILNNASTPGLTGWEIFCDRARYERGLKESHFYICQEEVEGKMCDMIGIARTDRLGEEERSSIRFYWVDRITHLPQAYQYQLIGRGRSALFPKFLVKDFVANPSWKVDPFIDVPAFVPRTGKKETPSVPKTVSLKKGDACPNVVLQTTNLKATNLPAQITGTTLVTFWAPWCGPCLSEMEALARMPQVKSGAIKVVALGVFDSKGNIRKLIGQKRYPFTFVIDPECELAASKVTQTFGISGIPHSFIFGKDKKLIKQWMGFRDKESLALELKGLKP